VKFTMQEANRLGLKMSINMANTGGSLRGPWDMKENGPKQLIWTADDITGPVKVEAQLNIPSDKKYFKDVALIAVRKKSALIPSENKQSVDLNRDWSVVSAPTEDSDVVLEVVDLSNHLDNENLKWDAPKGEWRIVRFGYHVIGEK